MSPSDTAPAAAGALLGVATPYWSVVCFAVRGRCKGELTSNPRNGYEGKIKILSIPYFAIEPVKNESQRSLKGSIQIEFMRRLIDNTILFEKVTLDNVALTNIRPLIGGAQFRSYLISSFEVNPTSYKVNGKGNGHGVGLSQWGANEMAEKGKTYKEIIGHYYPGTQVEINATSP